MLTCRVVAPPQKNTQRKACMVREIVTLWKHSQTGPEHCQLCSVAPLQAVGSRWVRSEMNLPKTIHDVNRHIEMWASLRTFWFSAHFWASSLEVVLECFWTCIEGIVLEHRGAGWTINDFDILWQQAAVPAEMARHITTWFRVWNIWCMHKFSIFPWHTPTGARIKTAQQWLLLASLGSYVLNTHSIQCSSWAMSWLSIVLLQPCPVKFSWTPYKGMSSPLVLWWQPLFRSWRLCSLRSILVKIRLSAKSSKWSCCATAQS